MLPAPHTAAAGFLVRDRVVKLAEVSLTVSKILNTGFVRSISAGEAGRKRSSILPGRTNKKESLCVTRLFFLRYSDILVLYLIRAPRPFKNAACGLPFMSGEATVLIREEITAKHNYAPLGQDGLCPFLSSCYQS